MVKNTSVEENVGGSEAKKPNQFCAFVGGGIAVEEVTHCLVELALAMLGGSQ
jgi:hypothetical protein